MTPDEYQDKALTTVSPLSHNDTLAMCALGLSGETGEINDILKKYLFHHTGKELPIEKLRDELGDLQWYVAVTCSTLGITLSEVMATNIRKLEARHNGTFHPHYSSDSVQN